MKNTKIIVLLGCAYLSLSTATNAMDQEIGQNLNPSGCRLVNTTSQSDYDDGYFDDFSNFSFDVNEEKTKTEDSLLSRLTDKAKKDLTNKTTKEVIKGVSQFVPFVKDVSDIYTKVKKMNEEYDRPYEKGEGTASRGIGDGVKNAIKNNVPGAGQIIGFAEKYIQPNGSNSVTESLLNIVVPEMGKSDDVSSNTKFAGSLATELVNEYTPFGLGKYVTTTTGYVGEKVFGTKTLTEGVLNKTTSLYNTFFG